MSVEDNKAVVVRWFTDFWGDDFDPAIIDEIAAPDIRFEYSLHQPLRGRDAVREFALRFRDAFPDLGFGATAELIADGDYVVGQWKGGGTHRPRIRRPPDRRAARQLRQEDGVHRHHRDQGGRRHDRRGGRPRRRRHGPATARPDPGRLARCRPHPQAPASTWRRSESTMPTCRTVTW